MFAEGDANLKELTGKVGLSCNGTPSETEGIECSKGTGETKVKQGSTDFNVSTLPGSNSGKIKVYKTSKGEDHKGNFKFVIEDGDISVSSGSTSNKLEQFETYEITEETGKHYLTRKTEAKAGIKKALGIESCELPTDSNNSTTCNSLDQAKIKVINFKDKAQDPTVTLTGNTSLKISKVTDTNFPFGYKFVFESESDISVPSTTESSPILLNKFTDFKINKPTNGNAITLEKAWTVATLIDKVGLQGCNTDNSECTIKGQGGLNVKHNTTKETGKTKKTTGASSPAGKIKLHTTNSSGYRENMKFTIEDGDFELEGNGSTISKLEQFETYEITEDSGTYYLTRKSEAKDGIKKALGLPDGTTCDLPTNGSTAECDIVGDKFKKIKFDGGDNERAPGPENAKLKISKPTGSSDYGPFGYKFVLESDKEAKISTSVTVKGKTNTEFKIKRKEGSNEISLEKAWSLDALAAKVGLESCSGTPKECTLKDNAINVYESDSKKIEGAKLKTGTKKMKVEEGQEGHSQGFKFFTEEEGGIEICKDDASSSGLTKIEKKDTATYEIGTKPDGSNTK